MDLTDIVETVFHGYPLESLTSLSVTQVGLTDRCFERLNTRCPNLESLSLFVSYGGGLNIPDSVFQNAKKVKTLVIYNTGSVLTDLGIQKLAEGTT
jgi:hypothetical protein